MGGFLVVSCYGQQGPFTLRHVACHSYMNFFTLNPGVPGTPACPEVCSLALCPLFYGSPGVHPGHLYFPSFVPKHEVDKVPRTPSTVDGRLAGCP